MKNTKENSEFLSTRRNFVRTSFLSGFLTLMGFPLLANKQRESKPSLYKPNFSNWQSIRKLFPFTKERIYFNTSSLGPPSKLVLESLTCAWEELTQKGSINRKKQVNLLRQNAAKLLGANEDEIAFTRNTTEGMNIVARTIPFKQGDEVILTTHEHIGGASIWLALEKELGISVKLVDLDLSGKNNRATISNAITEKTKLVVFSHVTCTTGMIMPAKKIAEVCKNNSILCCVDGAQAVGMIQVNLQDIQPDFYIGCGHKWLYGPQGSGFLYVSKEILKNYPPNFVGAYTDSEFNLKEKKLNYLTKASRLEYGTRNVPQMAGLSKAIDMAQQIGMHRIEERVKELANHFISHVNTINGFELLSPMDQSYRGGIVTIRIRGIESKQIRQKLAEEKIVVRHIYEADLDAVRFSFALFNTTEEVHQLVETLKNNLR